MIFDIIIYIYTQIYIIYNIYCLNLRLCGEFVIQDIVCGIKLRKERRIETIDHNPILKGEIENIDRGGRIEYSVDKNGKPYGPERVWLSYADSPGLAMTRSFGDKVGE